MAMSEQNCLGMQIEAEDFFGDKIGIFARIDDQTVSSVFIPNEVAVGLELTD